jgi:hypothetical protein
MANQLGSLKIAPREHAKHKRHSNVARRRHAHQLGAFLAAQATRLSSTSATVFAKLKKYGSDRVKAAANLAALP